MTRDEIAAEIREFLVFGHAHQRLPSENAALIADRILALLPPRESHGAPPHSPLPWRAAGVDIDAADGSTYIGSFDDARDTAYCVAAVNSYAPLPPCEPTPAMVEAMARAIWEAKSVASPGARRWPNYDELYEHGTKADTRAEARAAWAAGYAKWEGR
jgi:hypothetical protein